MSFRLSTLLGLTDPTIGLLSGWELRELIIPTPGTGQSVSQSIQDVELILVIGAVATLVTSVAAGSRFVRVSVQDGANMTWVFNIATGQLANTTRTYTWGLGVPNNNVPGDGFGFAQLPWTPITRPTALNLAVFGLDAADVLSNVHIEYLTKR